MEMNRPRYCSILAGFRVMAAWFLISRSQLGLVSVWRVIAQNTPTALADQRDADYAS
jgi:hypothetical protein